MVGLSNSEKIMKICLCVLTECTNMRHRQTPHDSKSCGHACMFFHACKNKLYKCVNDTEDHTLLNSIGCSTEAFSVLQTQKFTRLNQHYGFILTQL